MPIETNETNCVLANLNYIHQNVIKLTETIKWMKEKFVWAQPDPSCESVEAPWIIGFSEYLVNKLIECNKWLEDINKLI